MSITPPVLVLAAETVFWIHVAVIAFNVFGLVAVPVGACRAWTFVRVFWWRALHLAALVAVALQAVLGRACFLTIWESDLLARAGRNASTAPLLERAVHDVIYWALPLWVFALIYLAVFGYAVLLWVLVPPRLSPRPA